MEGELRTLAARGSVSFLSLVVCVSVGVGVGVGVDVSDNFLARHPCPLGSRVVFEDMGDKYATLRRAQLHLDFIHANS